MLEKKTFLNKNNFIIKIDNSTFFRIKAVDINGSSVYVCGGINF